MIKNPTTFAWIGLTFGLLTYHFSVSTATISSCDRNVWLILPLFFISLFPFIQKVIRHRLMMSVLAIIGAGSLFVPMPWAFGLGLTSFTLLFLPAIITNIKLAPPGVVIALVCSYLLHFFELLPEVSYFIFIFLEAIFIYLYFKNEYPFIKWKNSFKIINYHQVVLFLVLVSGISYVLLLFIWVCFFTTSVAFPGIVSGLILFYIINHKTSGVQNNWSHNKILGSIFTLFFSSMVLQGYLSRSFGFSFLIISIFLWITACTAVSYFFNEIKKNINAVPGNHIIEKKIYFSVVIFMLLYLSIQVPVCFLWQDKITAISLPENVFDLSISQYMLKNLTILPAISTILSGILFLKRKKWSREKFNVG